MTRPFGWATLGLAAMVLLLSQPAASAGAATRCDGFAFFRVTALRLDIVRTGHWRSPTGVIDAVQRDSVRSPGRWNLHPIPVSPPAAFGCGPQLRVLDVPVESTMEGSWRDLAPQPPGVPVSGPCTAKQPARGNQLNLTGSVSTRGAVVRLRPGLDLDNGGLSCEVPDRLDLCPDGDDAESCDPQQFYGHLDGSDNFFRADNSDTRLLPGKGRRLSAAVVLRRPSLTVALSGSYTYRGPWRKPTDQRIGDEQIDVAWSGRMTLRRYARCRRGQPLANCLPGRRP